MKSDTEEKLDYLRWWWGRYGNSVDFNTADDWINSLTNVALLETLSWAKTDD